MVRSLLAAALLFLAGAASTAAPDDARSPPAEIKISASVGEVIFRHEAHFQERAIACVQCHHEINAPKLKTPHPEYLKSAPVNCEACHEAPGKIKEVYDCRQCHRATPLNVADETLSAKVVIHKQCWNCHEAGTAKEASASCASCHTKKKKAP